jgi:selenocysteine lyase/cysteine desulfurase
MALTTIIQEEHKMDIQLADITLHVDETLDVDARSKLVERLRAIDGVVSVHNPDERQHLVVVAYRPDKTHAQAFLHCLREQNVHGELIGL